MQFFGCFGYGMLNKKVYPDIAKYTWELSDSINDDPDMLKRAINSD